MTADTSGFELPIRFSLQTSKWVTALTYSSHFGALLCAYLGNIPLLLTQMIFLMILISLVYWHYRYIYQLGQPPVELLLNDKDEWYIIDNKAGLCPVTLLPESFVHTHLLVLIFRQGKCKRVVILTTDNTRPEMFRRLSVRLRFTLSGERE